MASLNVVGGGTSPPSLPLPRKGGGNCGRLRGREWSALEGDLPGRLDRDYALFAVDVRIVDARAQAGRLRPVHERAHRVEHPLPEARYGDITHTQVLAPARSDRAHPLGDGSVLGSDTLDT